LKKGWNIEMKLKKEFIVHSMGNESVMIDATGKILSGIVNLNETAAFIANCLKNETTEESIVAEMCKEYDVDEERAKASIHTTVEKFKELGAIE